MVCLGVWVVSDNVATFLGTPFMYLWPFYEAGFLFEVQRIHLGLMKGYDSGIANVRLIIWLMLFPGLSTLCIETPLERCWQVETAGGSWYLDMCRMWPQTSRGCHGWRGHFSTVLEKMRRGKVLLLNGWYLTWVKISRAAGKKIVSVERAIGTITWLHDTTVTLCR